MAKNSISLWDSKTLLGILALAQSAALTYCFVVMDGHDQTNIMFYLSLLRGLTAGVGASFSASFVAYTAPRVTKAIAQQMAYWSFGILVVSELVFVSIVTNGAPTDGWRVAASVAGATLMSAAAVAVAACGGRLFAAEPARATAQAAGADAEPAKKSAKRKEAAPEFACKYAEQGCKVKKPTQEAINAHSGRCQFKPIKVDQDLLIK